MRFADPLELLPLTSLRGQSMSTVESEDKSLWETVVVVEEWQ